MSNISSGIGSLDSLIDSLYVGDNVVWETDAGTPVNIFTSAFIRQSKFDNSPVIYVSFNRSPQTVLKEIGQWVPNDRFVLVDCFTSGKGKGDGTFIRFYNQPSEFKVLKIESPSDIDKFTDALNALEDTLPSGARYIFDSLTGMQDLWGDESKTYKFFTYMCPRLFDLETVAYWILDDEAHSKNFKANLRHITQVVLSIYTRREKTYIKAIKLSGRPQRDLFRPHQFFLSEGEVKIVYPERESPLCIGHVVRELRDKKGLTQKELASRLDVTASFLSQLENNQISPSINTLIQLCRTLDVSPLHFFGREFTSKEESWLLRRGINPNEAVTIEEGVKGLEVFTDEKLSARIFYIDAGVTLKGHFNNTKRPEFVFVISGELTTTIEGQQETLSAGDCLLLKETYPTKWENKGGDRAEILVVW